MFRAKYGGQCPLCGKFWEPGAMIARLDEPVYVTFWRDFGRRKGEKYKVKMKYGCARCKREAAREKEAA